LIVKAVIARRMTGQGADPAMAGVPTTHDLPALWKEAALPVLEREDHLGLLLFKSVLVWYGLVAMQRLARKKHGKKNARHSNPLKIVHPKTVSFAV
jgi:hypothetical protein